MYRFLILLFVAGMAITISSNLFSAEKLDADTMKSALHTSYPEEDGFIDYVLTLVDEGTLPLEMVNSTFLWAKKKSRYKYQYFRYGLIYRAAQEGIDISWPASE